MRRISAEIVPADGEFFPTDRVLSEAPDVERVAIDHLKLLVDGSGVVMYRLRGERDRIEGLLDGDEDVRSYSVLPASDGHQVYVHFEVDGLAEDLLRMVDRYAAVIDFPVECTERGFRGTVIGEQDDFVAAMGDIPDGVRVELLSLTTFSGDTPGEPLLTERQRELLELALAEGYYDQPRGVTRDELADRLDLTGSTVSEHLRKAERKVLTEFVG